MVAPNAAPHRPSAEDARRQLEGRAEVVEDAVRAAAALESLLSGRRWRRHLRARPEVLQALLRQEPVLEEALERIHRRATAERWPEALPVLVTVRQLEALRARLTALVHQRLAAVAEPPPLREALVRLEERVLRPPSVELAPGETPLMEGGAEDVGLRRWRHGVLFLLVMASAHFLKDDRWGPQAVLCALFVGFQLSRSGRYLLTSERLVWRPRWREPVQLPLSSIPERGVQLGLSGVQVQGECSLALSYLSSPRPEHQDLWSNGLGDLYRFGRSVVRRLRGHSSTLSPMSSRDPALWLAAAVELRRLPVRVTSPLEEVACYPATFVAHRDVPPVEGHAVFRPGFVAFLPGRWSGLAVLEALTGFTPSASLARIPVPVLFEALRSRVPETTFDACVERAVAATGGVRWAREGTRYDERPSSFWNELLFWRDTPEGAHLLGTFEADLLSRVTRIVVQGGWSPRPSPGT